eukprot:TRINITY_DN7720_c0_g1_i1.p1 TRINITY_DN7720_c0_g1~~TRINITY_DN7720_c0_g1_i1.p1  ORF type:complete len:140 (+),score=25.96 TRINITY_DN7720_c0_g1_i1:43-462(+)
MQPLNAAEHDMEEGLDAVLGSPQGVTSVLRDVLQSRGVLEQQKAALRGELLRVLTGTEETTHRGPNHIELVVNELILEYLRFNSYYHAADVLALESGQPPEGLPRTLLERELQLPEPEPSLPLLYSVVAALRGNPGRAT